MRYTDGSLIGNLNDTYSAFTSGSRSLYTTSSVDENATNYDLIPTTINQIPIIIDGVISNSTPKIKKIAFTSVNSTGENFLYTHDDGSVKVHKGTSFVLSVEGEQPSTKNVNNGRLEIISPNSQLTYVWLKDGIEVGRGKKLSFKNVSATSDGVYACEVSNDIGSVLSEFITLEVLNFRQDNNFFTNLIQNGYGLDDVNFWESINSDLTVRQYTSVDDNLLQQPNRVDLTGYNRNMLYPKPQQVSLGVVKERLNQNMVASNKYFTRSKYTYEKKDGTTVVIAYQDVDLADLVPIVRGGVYGVKGVKALIGCYIGNALSNYVPVTSMVSPSDRTNSNKYDLSKPRLSLENCKKTGSPLPLQEQASLLIQEMNNESILKTYKIGDSWTKKIDQYRNYGSYFGSVPTNNPANAILYAADDLFSDGRPRYTYGQFVSFEKLVTDTLDIKTTKLRVSMIFETNDDRIFDTYKDFLNASDEVFELVSSQLPYRDDNGVQLLNTSNVSYLDQVQERIKAANPNKSIKEIIPSANNPCGFITGVNLCLIPQYVSPLVPIELNNTFV